MRAAEILRGARVLLAEPDRWSKGYFARDRSGNGISAHSPAAQSFCLVGACYKASEGSCVNEFEWSRATDALVREIGGSSTLPIFNDAPERTHGEILSTLDGAIAYLEALT